MCTEGEERHKKYDDDDDDVGDGSGDEEKDDEKEEANMWWLMAHTDSAYTINSRIFHTTMNKLHGGQWHYEWRKESLINSIYGTHILYLINRFYIVLSVLQSYAVVIAVANFSLLPFFAGWSMYETLFAYYLARDQWHNDENKVWCYGLKWVIKNNPIMWTADECVYAMWAHQNKYGLL